MDTTNTNNGLPLFTPPTVPSRATLGQVMAVVSEIRVLVERLLEYALAPSDDEDEDLEGTRRSPGTKIMPTSLSLKEVDVCDED